MQPRSHFSQFILDDGVVDLTSDTKSAALDELCARLSKHPNVTDPDLLHRAVKERETLVSTGIGLGVAIPHVKIPSVLDYAVVVGRHRDGIAFDAMDGEPVHLVFLIGAAQRQAGEFVRVLASIVRFVKEPENRDALLAAPMPDGFLACLRGASNS